VISDLAENAAVLVLQNNYPDRMYVLATAAPYFTSVKRAALLLTLFIPLATFLIWFVQSKFMYKNGLA
jgi:hypothetical protein